LYQLNVPHAPVEPATRPDSRARRCGDDCGQVAVEWLMVAGILTAVAIIIVGIVQPVLVEMVRMLARSVRMVGL